MHVSRIKPETLNTGNLGFGLGPRLNAAGRIDTARTSYDLLLSQSDAEAEPLALKLEDLNLERQKRLETALVSARETASAQAEGGRLIFVASADYQAGIVGLVAGRLVDEFYRPAIAIERGEELSRGSCRSVPEFHIARALDECADLLVRHGGHAMAAGFTVRTERLAELQEKLAAIAQRDLGERALEPTLAVDCQIALSNATWETRAKLSQLAPFGAGNPTPLLRSNNVRVRSVQLVRGDSVQLKLTNGSAETWHAIAFRQSHIAQMIHAGDRIDIVYNLEDRTWNGESTIQLVIKDVRKL
jgi:single-stranded-DNA-specific exonuclease